MVQFIDFRKMLVSVNTMLNTFYATELMVHLAKNVEDAFSRAGECLNEDIFWSTERLAYFLDWEDGEKVYYVDTDRHF